MNNFLFILLFLFSGCTGISEDFKEKGQVKLKELLCELKKIKNRDQLIDASPRLSACYEEIADLMIKAEKIKEPDEELSEKNHELNDRVRLELFRVYRLEGGKEILEKCQKKALEKLQKQV